MVPAVSGNKGRTWGSLDEESVTGGLSKVAVQGKAQGQDLKAQEEAKRPTPVRPRGRSGRGNGGDISRALSYNRALSVPDSSQVAVTTSRWAPEAQRREESCPDLPAGRLGLVSSQQEPTFGLGDSWVQIPCSLLQQLSQLSWSTRAAVTNTTDWGLQQHVFLTAGEVGMSRSG